MYERHMHTPVRAPLFLFFFVSFSMFLLNLSLLRVCFVGVRMIICIMLWWLNYYINKYLYQLLDQGCGNYVDLKRLAERAFYGRLHTNLQIGAKEGDQLYCFPQPCWFCLLCLLCWFLYVSQLFRSFGFYLFVVAVVWPLWFGLTNLHTEYPPNISLVIPP